MTTWDSSKKSGFITLSSGDLTGTLGALGHNNYNNAGSIAGISGTSKGFFSVVADNALSGGNWAVGVGNSSFLWTTVSGAAWLGINNNGIGFYPTGAVYRNGSSVLTWAAGLTAGAVYDTAVDFANARIWFRKNGGNWNNSGTADPATNTGGLDTSAITGTLYAAVTVFSNGDQFTANFGASAWTYAPPSGFDGLIARRRALVSVSHAVMRSAVH